MPIYEYLCQSCDNEFEELILGSEQPQCPRCESSDLEKKMSNFAVGEQGPHPGAAATAALSPFSGGGPEACGSCGSPDGPGSC